MNKINEVRAEIEKFFNPALIDLTEHESTESPSGKFSLEIDVYVVEDSDRNWRIAVAVITDRQTGEVIAQIKRNDDRFFHGWVECNSTEYLVCSEDMEGGQTVIDLTHRQLAGYSSESDPFIWAEFFPSPSGSKLAVSGCYWACPYEVKIYDFREPLRLPLNVIKEISFMNNHADFGEWISETAFSIKGANGRVSKVRMAASRFTKLCRKASEFFIIMQTKTTTCTNRESRWLRCWQILRAVLRGYCAGQPVNEERPRKVCC